MAYSTSTPPASSVDTDAPIMVVGNALDYSGGSHDGRWSATKDLAGTDATLAGFPVTRAYDGLWHCITKPDSDAATWYLVFYVDPEQPIDVVVILGHNFADAPSGFSWELGTADNNTFSSNAAVMASENSGITSKRRVKLMASRYSNVERVYLKVTAGSAWRPEIGDVILGARSQLEFKPREPYDDRGTASEIHRAESPGGVVTDVVMTKGRRKASLEFDVSGSTERDLVRAIFEDSDHGGRAVVLIDAPSTAPGVAYVMSLPPEFDVPIVESPYKYAAAFDLEERGPVYLVE